MSKKCKINIAIGTGSFVVEVDSTKLPTSMEELLQTLKQSKDWGNIKEKIRDSLIQRETINPVKLSELIAQSKVIPNTTTKVLKSKYSKARFPDGSDDIPILFVGKYETLKDGNMWGRYLQDGKEVFIVDVAHVNDFADYLSFRKMLEEGALNQYSEYQEVLQECVDKANKEFGVNTAEELLTKFVHERDSFKESKVILNNGSTLSAQLGQICGDVFANFGHFRKNHPNTLVNNIAHNTDIKHNSIFLNKEKFYYYLNTDGIIKFDSAKAFKEFFNKPVTEIKKILLENDIKTYKISNKETLKTLTEMFQNITETEDSWEVLTKSILSLDKTYEVSYSRTNNTDVVLSNFTNFKSFGIYMPTFKSLEIPKYYHGQYITRRVTGTDQIEFYVSRNYPLASSSASYFSTEQQARQYIDSSRRTVSEMSRINLHYLNTDSEGNFISEDSYRRKVQDIGKVSEGDVLTVLDYNLQVPKKGVGIEESNFLYGNSTLSDFESYLFNLRMHDPKTKSDFMLFLSDEMGQIIETLNSPEKIAIFVSEVARLKEKYTNKTLQQQDKDELLNEILPKLNDDNVKYKYYFVNEVHGNSAFLIPFKDVTELQEYQQENENIPVMRMWEAISEGLSPLLGNVKLNILTASQIQEKFKDYSDKKAFIKGGEVFINISNASTKDLLHEYAHIVLAYMKNNKEYRQAYKNLLQAVWDIASDKARNQVIADYRTSSLEDKMEELFVKEFGEEWVDKNNIQLDKIFRNNEALLKTKQIFDTSDRDSSLKKLYGRTMAEIFTYFNDNVSSLLSNNQGLMDEQFQKQFTLSRRQSDWINKRKDNGELEEVCE